MDSEFWHQRWRDNQIGFHASEVHSDLMANAALLRAGTRALVPMCGKSLDLIYLSRDLGLEVVGVELVEQAVQTFHDEHGIRAEREVCGSFTAYRSEGLTLYVGDIFGAAPELLGRFDRIWDRAALVALTREQREPYARRLRNLSAPGGVLLQNVVEYDQSVMDGPPWSVTEDEIHRLYGDLTVTQLRREDVTERFASWRERGHKTWISCCYRIDIP